MPADVRITRYYGRDLRVKVSIHADGKHTDFLSLDKRNKIG